MRKTAATRVYPECAREQSGADSREDEEGAPLETRLTDIAVELIATAEINYREACIRCHLWVTEKRDTLRERMEEDRRVAELPHAPMPSPSERRGWITYSVWRHGMVLKIGVIGLLLKPTTRSGKKLGKVFDRVPAGEMTLDYCGAECGASPPAS
jgi:hypothetical protein